MTTATAPQTVSSHLRPIDRDGLMAFAEKVVTTRVPAVLTKYTPLLMVSTVL